MLIYSDKIIRETIHHLQHGGMKGIETVVLWIGSRKDEQMHITEVFRPEQTAAADRFHITAESMRSLMAHLKQNRTRILAQVHSHPHEAFHSKADDNWAIIRHVGAVSLVLPDFAQHTSLNNFQTQVAAYQLSANNRWQQADFNSIARGQ